MTSVSGPMFEPATSALTMAYRFKRPPNVGDLLVMLVPADHDVPIGWTRSSEHPKVAWRISDGTEVQFECPVLLFEPDPSEPENDRMGN